MAVCGTQSPIEGGSRLVSTPLPENPAIATEAPSDVAKSLKAPVLGSLEQRIAGSRSTQLRDAGGASKSGKPLQIVIYPNTPHGFHTDYREALQGNRRRWLETTARLV